MAKAQKPGWKNKRLLLAGLVIVLVAGLFSYRAYAAWANKRDFAQVRAAIDTVYADIITKVGQPDNYKRTNDCSRPSQEFGQGPLSCSVGTDFIYGVDNEQQANQLLKQIQAVIASHPNLLKPTMPLFAGITDTLVVNSYYHAAGDSYRDKGLACRVNYVFNTPREIDMTIQNKAKYPFEITMDCYGPARAQYYSLSQ